MKIASTGLMIVASLTTCLFLASPVVSAAEKKSSAAPMQEMKGSGRLVIVRSAVLGLTVVGVRVDGVNVGEISYNRRYDAPLAAGSHVITAYPVHSLQGAKPAERKINVEPGRTYTFTVGRKDIDFVLK